YSTESRTVHADDELVVDKQSGAEVRSGTMVRQTPHHRHRRLARTPLRRASATTAWRSEDSATVRVARRWPNRSPVARRQTADLHRTGSQLELRWSPGPSDPCGCRTRRLSRHQWSSMSRPSGWWAIGFLCTHPYSWPPSPPKDLPRSKPQPHAIESQPD